VILQLSKFQHNMQLHSKLQLHYSPIIIKLYGVFNILKEHVTEVEADVSIPAVRYLLQTTSSLIMTLINLQLITSIMKR